MIRPTVERIFVSLVSDVVGTGLKVKSAAGDADWAQLVIKLGPRKKSRRKRGGIGYLIAGLATVVDLRQVGMKDGNSPRGTFPIPALIARGFLTQMPRNY